MTRVVCNKDLPLKLAVKLYSIKITFLRKYLAEGKMRNFTVFIFFNSTYMSYWKDIITSTIQNSHSLPDS